MTGCRRGGKALFDWWRCILQKIALPVLQYDAARGALRVVLM